MMISNYAKFLQFVFYYSSHIFSIGEWGESETFSLILFVMTNYKILCLNKYRIFFNSTD